MSQIFIPPLIWRDEISSGFKHWIIEMCNIYMCSLSGKNPEYHNKYSRDTKEILDTLSQSDPKFKRLREEAEAICYRYANHIKKNGPCVYSEADMKDNYYAYEILFAGLFGPHPPDKVIQTIASFTKSSIQMLSKTVAKTSSREQEEEVDEEEEEEKEKEITSQSKENNEDSDETNYEHVDKNTVKTKRTEPEHITKVIMEIEALIPTLNLILNGNIETYLSQYKSTQSTIDYTKYEVLYDLILRTHKKITFDIPAHVYHQYVYLNKSYKHLGIKMIDYMNNMRFSSKMKTQLLESKCIPSCFDYIDMYGILRRLYFDNTEIELYVHIYNLACILVTKMSLLYDQIMSSIKKLGVILERMIEDTLNVLSRKKVVQPDDEIKSVFSIKHSKLLQSIKYFLETYKFCDKLLLCVISKIKSLKFINILGKPNGINPKYADKTQTENSDNDKRLSQWNIFIILSPKSTHYKYKADVFDITNKSNEEDNSDTDDSHSDDNYDENNNKTKRRHFTNDQRVCTMTRYKFDGQQYVIKEHNMEITNDLENIGAYNPSQCKDNSNSSSGSQPFSQSRSDVSDNNLNRDYTYYTNHSINRFENTIMYYSHYYLSFGCQKSIMENDTHDYLNCQFCHYNIKSRDISHERKQGSLEFKDILYNALPPFMSVKYVTIIRDYIHSISKEVQGFELHAKIMYLYFSFLSTMSLKLDHQSNFNRSNFVNTLIATEHEINLENEKAKIIFGSVSVLCDSIRKSISELYSMNGHLYISTTQSVLYDLQKIDVTKPEQVNKPKELISRLSKSDKIYLDDGKEFGQQNYFNWFCVSDTGFLCRSVSYKKNSSLFMIYNYPEPLHLLITKLLYKSIIEDSDMNDETKRVRCEIMKTFDTEHYKEMNETYLHNLSRKDDLLKVANKDLDRGKPFVNITQLGKIDKKYNNTKDRLLNSSQNKGTTETNKTQDKTFIDIDMKVNKYLTSQSTYDRMNESLEHDSDTYSEWKQLSDDPFCNVRDLKRLSIYGNQSDQNTQDSNTVFNKYGYKLVQTSSEYKSLIFSNVTISDVNPIGQQIQEGPSILVLSQDTQLFNRAIYLEISSLYNSILNSDQRFLSYRLPLEHVIKYIFKLCYSGLYAKEQEHVSIPLILSGFYHESIQNT